MRRIAFIYILASALSTILFAIVLGLYGTSETIDFTGLRELSLPEHLSSDASLRKLDDIWFDSAGNLVVLSRTQTQILVHLLTAQGTLAQSRWVDLAPFGGSEVEPQYSPKSLEPGSPDLERPIFAVSLDSRYLAWLHKGRLVISTLEGSNLPAVRLEAEIDSSEASPAEKISFAGQDLVAVVRKNGALELWSYAETSCGKSICKGKTGSSLNASWSLWPIQSGAVAASPTDVCLVTTKSANSANLSFVGISDPGVSALSASLEGRVAVGTQDGVVVGMSGSELKERTAARLPIAQRVKGLSFLGESILAAGDFSGVYLVEKDRHPSVVLPFQGDVMRMASSETSLAVLSTGKVWLSEIRLTRRLNHRFDRLVAFFSLYISVLAIVFSFHTYWLSTTKSTPKSIPKPK